MENLAANPQMPLQGLVLKGDYSFRTILSPYSFTLAFVIRKHWSKTPSHRMPIAFHANATATDPALLRILASYPFTHNWDLDDVSLKHQATTYPIQIGWKTLQRRKVQTLCSANFLNRAATLISRTTGNLPNKS